MTEALLAGPDRNGRKIAVVDGLVAEDAPEDAVRLPCPDAEIVPGAVCAHTHIYSGLARFGMPKPVPEPENFVQILERIWWRLDRALDERSLLASAEDYVAQSLLAGTTTLIDHHESPNFIEGSLPLLQRACEGLGIRAVLCYGATERNFGEEEANRGLDECERVIASRLVRGMVGLHAGFTVSDQTIIRAARLARKMDSVLHIHVAEDGADVRDAIERGYAGPIERLTALGALVPGSLLVHGVHLSPDQVRQASAQGCWFAHNPRSNEGNRVGYAKSLKEAANVALGTDGWNADMAEEERALFRLAPQYGDDRAEGRLVAGQRLVAQRFGSNPQPLAPGAVGDFVIRQKNAVRHVVVDGRIVVRDGQLASGNIGRIVSRSEREAARLFGRMAAFA